MPCKFMEVMFNKQKIKIKKDIRINIQHNDENKEKVESLKVLVWYLWRDINT